MDDYYNDNLSKETSYGNISSSYGGVSKETSYGGVLGIDVG